MAATGRRDEDRGMSDDQCPVHDAICGCAMYSDQQKGGKHFPDCPRGQAKWTCELSPYETGVCPGCGQPVVMAQCDVTVAGGPVERIDGRWMCRTIGCKYGEPEMRNGAA